MDVDGSHADGRPSSPVYIHRDTVRWLLLIAAWLVVFGAHWGFGERNTALYLHLFWVGNSQSRSTVAPLLAILFIATPVLLSVGPRWNDSRWFRASVSLPLLLIWLYGQSSIAVAIGVGYTIAAVAFYLPPARFCAGNRVRHWRMPRAKWTAIIWLVRIVAMPSLGPAIWFLVYWLFVPQGPDFTGLGQALLMLALSPVFLIMGAVLAVRVTRPLFSVRTGEPVEFSGT